MPSHAFWLINSLICLAATATCSEPPRSRTQSQQQASQRSNTQSNNFQRKPNIVLILTDDQDVELGSLNYMPKTLRSIKEQGAEFRHAYVTTPMCCPSRSSLLTGMYVHNHNVYTNNDNCSSTQWQASHERKSFATYLNNAGYRTGYFGKYLNKYNGSYVPPGWREWGGLIMNSKYYNYSINMNGKKIKHGFDYYKDYLPDLITNDSIAFLRQSKKNNAHKPVMLTMSFPAPHGPEDSAPQYSHLFFNETTHHTPSYNFAPNPDKQWILQVTNPMLPIHKKFTDLLMTKRLQTLQSVDSAVQLVVNELEELGELDNTYIIYTSDHGYHLGQFGLIKGKSFPFEFDVRVPFLVRGPGIEPGTTVQDIVLNIDLAPTFLNIAGVEQPPHMDGRSILPLLHNTKRKRARWPDTFLIESSGRRETPFLDAKMKAIRKNGATTASTTSIPLTTHGIEGTTSTLLSTTGFTTTTSTTTSRTTTTAKIYESGEEATDDDDEEDDINDEIDEEEDDDIDPDPKLDNEPNDELNFNDDANSTNKILIRGEDNNDLLTLGQMPYVDKVRRLQMECSQNEMNLPCRINQKWYCFNDNGRWRKHKCKLQNIPTHNMNKQYRRCACFTPEGLIYKKMPLSVITRRHAQDRQIKHVIFTPDHSRLSKRHRRSALDQVEGVMRDVAVKLQDLKSRSNRTAPAEDRSTNIITETAAYGCAVLPSMQVNCSNVIYHDRKTWRESRHRIDNEIHQLKQKIDQLKEIRRHLKHTPPVVADPAFFLNESEAEGRRGRKRQRVEASTLPNPHRHHKSTDSEPITTKAPNSTTPRADAAATTKPPEFCHCDTDESDDEQMKDAERRRLKAERLRRKLRKKRKRVQLEKECAYERMNCFHHDNDHWKTEPMWRHGPFCFCMNANNNTYSCVRTINATHNILYCEFTTGLVTFYNLRIDPYELQNRAAQLKPDERRFLHMQLRDLVACRGRGCTVGQQRAPAARKTNLLPAVARHGRRRQEFMFGGDFGGEEALGRSPGAKVNIRSRNITTADKVAIAREARINRRKRRKS